MLQKRNFFNFKEGSRVNQIICAILINLPVFSYGASIGWMSPMTLLLQSKESPAHPPLTDFSVSMMGGAAYLVCIPFNFIMAWIGDRFGRKVALMFMSASAAMGWIIKLSSMEVWAFVLGRAFLGIPMAGAYVTCPLYNKEISENCIRGRLGSMLILAHTSGNLFLYIIGDLMPYRAILWVCLALPVAHLILFLQMPETPSYLIKCGKIEEATRALAWLRCRQVNDINVIAEINEIKTEQALEDESNKFVLKAIVTDKILHRAFRISIAIALTREVCGAIPVLNFAGEIFQKASRTGLVLSPNQQAMMLGAMQVAGSALASSVIEKTGRRILLIISSLISGLGMCGLASWFLCQRFDILAPEWIPVATLCLCIFCDSSGLQPLSVVIPGEMFSFKFRGTVMAFIMAVASIAAFIQVLFFKPLTNAVGINVSFYFFGVICLFAACYFTLVVPETRMKSVSEIQECLKTKKEKRKEVDLARSLSCTVSEFSRL